jgi:hypothetical protein
LAAGRGAVVATKDAMAAEVRSVAQPGDAVLVKASRGLALDTVAADLLTFASGEPRGWRASGSEGTGPVGTTEERTSR